MLQVQVVVLLAPIVGLCVRRTDFVGAHPPPFPGRWIENGQSKLVSLYETSSPFMKYYIINSFLVVGCEAFAPISLSKTLVFRVAPFAIPQPEKTKYSRVVAPWAAYPTVSSSLNMENSKYDITTIIAVVVTIVGIINLILGIVGFFNSLKNEIKADLQGLKTELKSDVQGLKTELKTDVQGLKTELKTDIEKGIEANEAKIKELKTDIERGIQANEEKIKELKTDVSSQIDRIERSLSVRVEAQDKIIEAHGIKIEGRLLVHEARHKKHQANGASLDEPSREDTGMEVSKTTIDSQGENTESKN